MKLMLSIVLVAVVAAAPSALLLAQARADVSGKWTYDPDKSRRGDVQFPTDLVIKQSPAEVDIESSSTRQKAVTVVYRLDGAETTTVVAGGITVKGKAKMDGDKLLIEETRSFDTPAGEITNEIKDVCSVTGATLTIQRTVTTAGVETKGMAAYSRVAP